MTQNNYSDMISKMKKTVENHSFSPRLENAGRITACGDGVLRIEGLRDVKNGELIYITEDTFALAMNLETDHVGAILLTESHDLSQGSFAYCTGQIISVPVGDELLGRVIDPLGRALDGKKAISTSERRSIESPAPPIFSRAKVSQPLLTGIKALDSMVPIGKGQRELIIGDRQTGKTAIAIDTIINQRDKGVVCVYVAIGQKTSTVNSVIHALKDHGAMDYTVVVASTAGQSAPLQYISPYTGTAVAEYFMYSGKDVLIVYDDLSKHAVAYRTISLLLYRPSGREAYPGDIFYIHSKLLERSAKLSDSLGGGSLTALPIIETLAGDISSYIPTNVISITDGQIYLESALFNSGMRPAVNVGLSVSRVGSSAQSKAMRSVSSQVRLELAHFREMEQFSQFGADLDQATKATLQKGARITESLKQEQYSPVPSENMVIELYIMTNDLLKNVDVEKIRSFMSDFFDYIGRNCPELPREIAESKELTDSNKQTIEKLLKSYSDTYE